MPSWKPEQLGERTWLLPTGVNAGLWEAPEGAVLIDSGGDKESGRQIRQTLEERGWTLRLIVNTHSNADHVGGNAYLQKQTGCRVAATRLEAAFITDPVLEPSFLWGAAPFRELRGKFLQASPSTVNLVLPDSGPLVAANRAALQRTADAITASCSRPAGFEEILAELCRVFAIELNPSQYVLVGGTLRAYLAWLCDRGTLRPSFEGGRMLWSPGPPTS